jgi:hypothetical protein
VPLVRDFEVHARLLFALPLLILAEAIVYLRMRAVSTPLLERQIITDATRPAFERVLSSATRLRTSLAAEFTLLLVVILAGWFIRQEAAVLHSDTWYGTVTGPNPGSTLAGRWYALVSVPIFQFMLLRWYFRLFIWCRFLFQLARLDLNLIPLHPDRCCALGFLGNLTLAFAPVLAAHSGLACGSIANRIVHEGAKLPNYSFQLAGLVVFLLAIVLGPLCVFTPKLNRARLAGLRTYGRLASDYATAFAGKWQRGAAQQAEPLLGSSDIQSMADLDGSFAIVREAKIVPVGREIVLELIFFIALPLAPLVLTMFSVEELVKGLIQLVL